MLYFNTKRTFQNWRDVNLVWNPKEFGGVTKINVPANMIWKPDILLYNRYFFDIHIRIKLIWNSISDRYLPTSNCLLPAVFSLPTAHCQLILHCLLLTASYFSMIADLAQAHMSFRAQCLKKV